MDSIPVISQIFDLIGFLLAQIYSVIPNLGVAIILLTIGIFFALYPLTAKQTRSMLAMQAVQPEIKKLQAKYKNDRQKLNEETMKFYQENKINPLSGCLPLLLQMPILIALFSVLRSSWKYIPNGSSLYTDLCEGLGRLKPDGTWTKCGANSTRVLLERYPVADVKPGEPLVHHLHFLGLDLQESAVKVSGGFLEALPYFLLVALVIISYVVSTRQSQKRTPAANKQMGTVMKILPPFFGLISITLPSGVVLYLLTSSVFRVLQQQVIFNRHGHILTSRPKSAVDVKSTERADPKPVVRPKSQPAKPRPPQGAIGRGTAPAAVSGALPGDDEKPRGMRGFFQLPPPPESTGGNGADAAVEGATDPSPTTSSSAQNRRRRNKKRKR